MSTTRHFRSSDLLGFSRLATEATAGITGLVEAVHSSIAAPPGCAGDITRLVYDGIRAVTGVAGISLAALLTPITLRDAERSSSRERDAVLAALNGVIGDYLAAAHNPLAIPMRLRRNGRALTLERHALAAAIPEPGGKLVVLAHGLCMSDRQWTRKGHNHGKGLARDLGFTAVDLHYNGGLHISTNGRALADLLEALVEQWPAPLREFVIIAHSMGGLVTRSAWHYGVAAGHRWPARLDSLVFLGTPHHGAPLERLGNWVNGVLELSPYTAPLARLGRIRSAGITDLRYGNLLDEDWEGRDRFHHSGDLRRPLPLPENVRCCAIAATTTESGTSDGFVPLSSALGLHREPGRSLSFPESRLWIGRHMNHWDLLSNRAVYEHIKGWLAGGSSD